MLSYTSCINTLIYSILPYVYNYQRQISVTAKAVMDGGEGEGWFLFL